MTFFPTPVAASARRITEVKRRTEIDRPYAITDLAADPEGKRVYVGLSRQSAYYQYDTGLVGVIDTTTKVITMEQKMMRGIRDRACQTRVGGRSPSPLRPTYPSSGRPSSAGRSVERDLVRT